MQQRQSIVGGGGGCKGAEGIAVERVLNTTEVTNARTGIVKRGGP